MTPIDEIRAGRERPEEGWTPGAWKLEELSNGGLGLRVDGHALGGMSGYTAFLYPARWGDYANEVRANARVMLAARELYYALEEAHAALQALTPQAIGGVPQYAIIAMCKASAAMAKARGESVAEIEHLNAAETSKREEG